MWRLRLLLPRSEMQPFPLIPDNFRWFWIWQFEENDASTIRIVQFSNFDGNKNIQIRFEWISREILSLILTNADFKNGKNIRIHDLDENLYD